MTKCVIISSQSLFLLEYSSKGLSNKCIYWVYLKISKPRCARELLYPSPPATPSTFGARLTPLNRTSFEKRKKQSFNGFCHIPFCIACNISGSAFPRRDADCAGGTYILQDTGFAVRLSGMAYAPSVPYQPVMRC